MYIDSISIKNYFSIDEAGISIENLNKKDKSEIYFAGENGVGKTILLQSFALAISEAVKGKQQIGAVIDVLNQN